MSLLLNLTIRSGDFSIEVELDLPNSGVTAVFGPSGCGKTSLLRAIGGLDHHKDAVVKFNQLTWQGDAQFVPTHQRQLAYVFQEPSLFPHLDVRGNLEFAAKRVPPERVKFSIERVAHALGITALLERSVAGLSGGEKQRVSIARAVSASPSLLLMDEPLSALDRDAKQDIFPYIEKLSTEFEMPIIYVSHSLDEVAQLADHLVLMSRREGPVAHGDIQTMLTRLDLSLAQDAEAESIFSAKVVAHDEAFHLSYLDSAVGRFSVPRTDLELGTRVRLRIAARDVSVTLKAQSGTSILNIFAAKVEEIFSEDRAQYTVRLNASGVHLLAKLTPKSVSALDLVVGMSVYVQVKSVALL